MSFRLIVSVLLQLLANSHDICFLDVVRSSRTFQQVVRLNIETPKALRVDREEASLPSRLLCPEEHTVSSASWVSDRAPAEF